MLRSRVLCTVLILSFFNMIALACDVMYLREPVSSVRCNPYSGEADINLQCVIQAPVSAGPRLDIVWLFTNTISGYTVQINMNTFPTPPLLSITSQNRTVRNGELIEITSTMALGEFSFPTHAGSYFCQVEVDGLTSSLSPSNAQTYSDNEAIHNENPCGTTIEHQFTKTTTRCAGNLSVFTMSVPAAATNSPTSKVLPDPPISFPGPVSSSTPAIASSTTDLSMEVSTTSQSPSSGSVSFSMWVYVLVGVAAVFAIIILVLTILCIGLCLKKNKTTDSFKQKTPELRQFTTTSMVTNGLYQQKDENSFTDAHQSSHLQIADYNTLGERDYEIIDVNECKKDYNHLQRPSPPTGPGGKNGTFVFASSKEFHSMSTLTSQQGGAAKAGGGASNRVPNGGQLAGNRQGGGAAVQHGVMSPAAGAGMFPPKSASVGPEDHVYRELEWKTQAAPTSAGLPSTQPPINNAATLPSIYRSPTDSVPPESARSLNRRFMRDGINAIDEGGHNQAVFFPADNQFNGVQPAGLQNKPETGTMFAEPPNPAAFPVHNYERVTGEAEYETPIVTRKTKSTTASSAAPPPPPLAAQTAGRTSQSSMRGRSDSAGIRYETELTQSLGENSGGGGGHYHRLVRNSGDHSCTSREASRQEFDDTVTDVTSVTMEDGFMTMNGTLSTLDGTLTSHNGNGLQAFENPSSNSARASLQDDKSRFLGNSIYDPRSSSSATESLSSYLDHLQAEDDEEPMNDALFQEIAASLGAVPEQTAMTMESRGASERPMEMHNGGVWRSNSNSSRGDRRRHHSDNTESPYSRLSGHHGGAGMGGERPAVNVLPRICRDVESSGVDYGMADFSRLKTVV